MRLALLIIAGLIATSPAAQAQNLWGIANPWLIEPNDAERYRRIFEIQEAAHWQDADILINQLEDRRLMGHVLFQRYMHPTGWRSTYQELRDWLALYADQPGSRQIQRLGNRRRGNQPSLPRPTIELPVASGQGENFGAIDCEPPDRNSVVRNLTRQTRRDLSRSRPTATRQNLASQRNRLRADEYAYLMGLVAQSYYIEGLFDKAGDTAADALATHNDPTARWIAGLVAWRMQSYGVAAVHFEQAYDAECGDAWTKARTAFWAGRAWLRAEQPEKLRTWLLRAAQFPLTFYGQLSLALGGDLEVWSLAMPPLNQGIMRTITDHPAGARALGLVQVGRMDRAELELMYLAQAHRDDPELLRDIAVFAYTFLLPRAALFVGSIVTDEENTSYAAALYPMGPWHAQHPVSSALIHAIIRQESRFRPDAVSNRQAYGLMQVRPIAAKAVTGDRYRTTAQRRILLDPNVNVELGKAYFKSILVAEEGDLIYTIASYNAGPTQVKKHRAKYQEISADQSDPLLAIHSIPWIQTRQYIERIMANYWIYRHLLELPTPSLETLASNRWPVLSPEDLP
ncbi:MAG: lytic transglycosylase domain-containing protein [Pseudomonadota bacterium]